jgi:nucleoid-associated protein YgaU
MRIFTALFAVGILVFSGCEKKVDTQKERIELGERRAKLGEFKAAISAYEAALDGSPKTAEVHYRIALLYDDKLKDYLDAVHHYDRYLEFAPSGPHVADAKAALKECLKHFQSKVSNEGFMPQSEAARMRRDMELAVRDNDNLKAILDEHKINYKSTFRKQVEEPPKGTLPPGTREYKVKRGDTLASIARVFYKNAALAGHIKDANQNQLNGKDFIKEGQILIIPEAPAR